MLSKIFGHCVSVRCRLWSDCTNMKVDRGRRSQHVSQQPFSHDKVHFFVSLESWAVRWMTQITVGFFWFLFCFLFFFCCCFFFFFFFFFFHKRTLTFTTPWTNAADDKLIIWFSYFFQKTSFNTTCKLSLMETICMSCQACFLIQIIKKYFLNVICWNFTQSGKL